MLLRHFISLQLGLGLLLLRLHLLLCVAACTLSCIARAGNICGSTAAGEARTAATDQLALAQDQ